MKNIKYLVTLVGSNICQKNLKTNYERPVRLTCSIQNSNSQSNADKNACWIYWEWLNENNNWIAYSPHTTIELEKNFQQYILQTKNNNNKTSGNNLIKIFLNELKTTSYLIDFKKMEQINEKTNFSRKLRRQISDTTNIKIEITDAESENEAPVRSLRKRKSVSYNKNSSTNAEHAAENARSGRTANNKKLKKGKSTIKEEVYAENDVEQNENKSSVKKESNDVKIEIEVDEEVTEEEFFIETKVKRGKSGKNAAKSEEEFVEEEISKKSHFFFAFFSSQISNINYYFKLKPSNLPGMFL